MVDRKREGLESAVPSRLADDSSAVSQVGAQDTATIYDEDRVHCCSAELGVEVALVDLTGDYGDRLLKDFSGLRINVRVRLKVLRKLLLDELRDQVTILPVAIAH